MQDSISSGPSLTKPETSSGVSSLTADDQSLRKQRGSVYGDHVINHETLGLMWTGLLQTHYQMQLPHPIPAALSAQMMVALKLARLAKTPDHEDSIQDLRVYAAIAVDCAHAEKT